jgi:hypothetical protein
MAKENRKPFDNLPCANVYSRENHNKGHLEEPNIYCVGNTETCMINISHK